MNSVPSATTWGSPTATKHALLLHGLTSSSHAWHRVASALATQGFYVTAPNLVGHVSRTSTDYDINSVVADLRPYLDARRYTLIVGHSWGCVIALSLFPHLPSSHPTAIVLVDPPLNRGPERLAYLEGLLTQSCVNVTSAETYHAENPSWTPQDSVYRELGTRLCSVDALHGILKPDPNRPWNFLDYLKAIPDKWNVTVMVADPAVVVVCPLEDIDPYPHVRRVVVPGAGHWIQYEFPDVIVEEALKRVAELDALD